MSGPANSLQKAIYAALAADTALTTLLGGARIHDRTPADVAFPYIVFGRTSVFDWSTATEAGAEQFLTLHVWSKAKGRRQAFDIVERLTALLHDQPLTLTGQALVNCRIEASELVHDDGLDLYHGVLRLRAVTEPA